ncbi:hypothetical protein Dsin_020667 [Dipteronia sinensis]|uniref:Uncharacterized protein n=1 Tax=Dipteronia sinensis TaxID=43782 RepID=A0AAE0E471_9ROSI|nr:hypothetical protein Dsin_020667 [Dipteronia sinensis]
MDKSRFDFLQSNEGEADKGIFIVSLYKRVIWTFYRVLLKRVFCLTKIIHENKIDEEGSKMPLLVYVSRERRASYPHRFKAGALNTLLRVSGIMSNGQYIMVLNCDMYCKDPTTARQTMCFNFDPNISPSLAYVQFPQMFYIVNDNDIYEGGGRSAYMSMWEGMDGFKLMICCIFNRVFLSSLCNHLYDVLSTGETLRTLWNEQRFWMIQSVSGNLFGCIDMLMKRNGAKKASFRISNKAMDKEKLEKYEKGKYDFEGADRYMVPMTIMVILNIICFFGGIIRLVLENNVEDMFGQLFLSLYVLFLSYPIIEGLISSKSKTN